MCGLPDQPRGKIRLRARRRRLARFDLTVQTDVYSLWYIQYKHKDIKMFLQRFPKPTLGQGGGAYSRVRCKVVALRGFWHWWEGVDTTGSLEGLGGGGDAGGRTSATAVPAGPPKRVAEREAETQLESAKATGGWPESRYANSRKLAGV